jgi:hypothetical protein
MDALAEVRNEETRLRDAGLLQSTTILVARSSTDRSSSARPTALVPLASPPVVPLAACVESVGLHCDHCGRDGHVEALCYRKKKAQKAQTCRSSQGIGGTDSEGFERSSAGSEIQEILMLLCHLVAFTSARAVGSVTQSSTLIGSATTSQSSTSEPPFSSFSRYLSMVS